MSIVDWLDERTGLKQYWQRKKELLIPDHVTFFYCFGGISFTIILLQLFTGLSMLFFYVPRAEEAFDSIIRISNEVPLGWLMRNMHRWGATIIVATLMIHMANVFYHKAFRGPREFNWLSGFTMLIVVFIFSFTGTILPWNWRSYWVLVIATDFIGTWPGIGGSLKWLLLDYFTVYRSFIIHIFFLPLLAAILLTFHFKMVKRHGISGPL